MPFSRLKKPLLGALVGVFLMPAAALAESAKEIEANVNAALTLLYSKNPAAAALGKEAEGILVFPHVVKGGLIIGAAHGTGALRIDGTTEGYYQTSSGSLGLQAGIESRKEVIMFMTTEALNKFKASKNWQAGVDGSISVIQTGVAGSANTKNQTAPIIGYIFGNEGLYGGLNFEGAKISHYTPE